MSGRFFNVRSAIVLGVILLVVVTAALGRRLAVQSVSPLTLLADDFRTGGGAGVVHWAARLQLPTLALRAPAWELNDVLPETGHCLITAGNGSWHPFGDGLESEQWHEISRWVQAGNSLIVVTSDTDSLPKPLRDHFTTDVSAELLPRFSGTPPEEVVPNEPDVAAVATRWGGELSVTEAGPRMLNPPDEWVLAGSSGSSESLASAVLVKRPLGDGQIYLLLDEFAWTNAGFDRADNAAVLARILRDELGPQGVLAIDHYRHGRGRVDSFATFLFALPGAPAFCGMSLLIALFWVWARNQRLGPAEEFHEPERRTASEYIEAVAAMNLRARAASLAVESVAGRVNALLHQRGHISDDGRQLIEQARRHVRREERPASPTAEIKLVTDLIQLRKKLYGTRSDT